MTWVQQNSTSRQADGNGGSSNYANNANEGPALAIQPDGKIVIAGTCSFTGYNHDFCLVRYLTDGTLDASFGPFCTTHSATPEALGCSGLFDVPGEVVTDVASGPNTILSDYAMDIALQADGHIVVVGWCRGDVQPQFCFARYAPNGALVSEGFSVVGDITGEARSVAVQSDGKVLVAGPDADTSTGSTMRVTRFSAEMVVDPTFGSGGTTLVSGPGPIATSLAIQPDGKIVVGGICGATSGCIARLDVDGSLDGSFGIDGLVSGFPIHGNRLDVAVASDGKIVASGNCEGTSEMCAGRFESDGSPDRMFGDGTGFARTGLMGEAFAAIAQGMAVDPRGRMVVGGYCASGSPSNLDFCLARFRTSGGAASDGSDWPQFRFDPAHSGLNGGESTLTTGNVGALTEAFRVIGPSGVALDSPASPTVAGGVVYIGSTDSNLYAFDAAGISGCAGSPAFCAPLWTAPTGSYITSSAAVADGIVFVQSQDGNLYAFDAAGVAGCAGAPKVCAPLWTAPTGSVSSSSPTVVDGVVYVGSSNGNLYAFDASGVSGCAGTPKVCAPLWTAPAGNDLVSSPAVAGGVVYIGSNELDPSSTFTDGYLYAFDAAGVSGCSGDPKVCAPLWKSHTGQSQSSPAVADGVVYIGSLIGGSANGLGFAAFDGATGDPLWTTSALGGITSSPAVANGVVYIGGQNGTLYALGTDGQMLWSAPSCCTAYGSSPAVAGGVVFVGGGDGNLQAFDAAGVAGCSGSPTVCTPLWAERPSTDNFTTSSPAVAGGVVYINSTLGQLYAYSLPTSAPTLASIAVTPANPTIPAGTNQQFTATGTYSDASTADLTASVTWASATPAAATISAAGLAHGVAIGTSSISATLGAVSGSTTLTVSAPTLASIAVTPANPTIPAGTNQQFTATGTYSDASTADLTASVTWASATPAAATIAPPGSPTASRSARARSARRSAPSAGARRSPSQPRRWPASPSRRPTRRSPPGRTSSSPRPARTRTLRPPT